MFPNEGPLHPLLVHFPLALAILLPLVVGLALVAGWRGWLSARRVWVGVVLFQLLLLATAILATRTGEAEEDRVEPVVGEAALEVHEETAEVFVIAAGVVLLLALGAWMVPGERLHRSAAALTLVGTLAEAGLAVRTGRAGGELVYVRGAAAAWTGPAVAAPAESHDD